MKIATYNVNGVNGRLPVLLRWLGETAPDIVCLQELKAPQEKFPEKAIADAGYHALWHGQKSWNGVAILSRKGEIREVRRALPGDLEDVHSRYIEAVIDGICIGCLYLPNGNPAPGPKFDYKLGWFKRLTEHAAGFLPPVNPWYWQATITSCPPNSMFTNPSVGWMMHCSGPKHARLSKHWLHRVGRMQYENCTRRRRFIRFGIISVMPIPATQVYVLIISCLARPSANASRLPGWTARCVDGKKQATMPRYGLNWLANKVSYSDRWYIRELRIILA